MTEYSIIDLHNILTSSDGVVVEATSPEKAAAALFGEELVRSGARRELRAKVYFQHPGQVRSMVRLYQKVAGASA